MEKNVVFGNGGQQLFEQTPNNTLRSVADFNLIDNLGNDIGLLANFNVPNNVIDRSQSRGYIVAEEALRDLIRNVDGRKIEGVSIRFALDNGKLHLVFVPIEKKNDGSYQANYSNAKGTFSPNPPTPDPILTNPPHSA